MSKYIKDEINFYKFLNVMRQLHEVTLEQVCGGLCSVSMMKQIEVGERLPEKQMRDCMMSRMGVLSEVYEDYLSVEEYEQWLLRQKLFESIEEKNIEQAERYLKSYQIYREQNMVEIQYCEAMKFLILQMKSTSLEIQRETIERAVKCTMPDMGMGLSEKVLLSEQELNLLIEYVRLCKVDDISEEKSLWRFRQYKTILNYMGNSHLERFSREKVYPKAAYYLCEEILHSSKTEEDLELGIKVCNQAIELLRDTGRLYYFVELVERLEKLIKELSKKKKKEELVEQMAALKEKRNWYEIIMELYKKYGVEPYMQNFCYLYQERDSYCISDVVKTRRNMLGMTREELCEGICSVKTLTRLELKKAKTQMSIVRQLFERLGLCAEYIRARVISSDYEVLQLAEKFAWYENNNIMKEWIWCLKELEKKLCMEIPQNRQFIEHSRFLLAVKLKEMSEEEFRKKMMETIEYMIPLECVMKEGKKFLSREEYTYIHSLAVHSNTEKDNPYMKVIEEVCEQRESGNGITMSVSTYEFLKMGLMSYWGNMGKYEESDELSSNLIKESLQNRRQVNLAEALYNNIWNERQQVLEHKKIHRKYEKEKDLEKCILLAKYGKQKKFIKFFEKELENWTT